MSEGTGAIKFDGQEIRFDSLSPRLQARIIEIAGDLSMLKEEVLRMACYTVQRARPVRMLSDEANILWALCVEFGHCSD